MSGGRGAGSAEGFAAIEELAELLGGAVGCSRAVTIAGWRPHTDQVGQRRYGTPAPTSLRDQRRTSAHGRLKGASGSSRSTPTHCHDRQCRGPRGSGDYEVVAAVVAEIRKARGG